MMLSGKFRCVASDRANSCQDLAARKKTIAHAIATVAEPLMASRVMRYS
jgi:hypothetical protein